MVDTLHLLPPGSGLSSDPLLFGVAEALSRLFPVEEVHPRREVAPADTRPVENEPAREDGIAA